MKKIVMGITLALTASLAFARDNNFDDRWYVTPNASVVVPDSDKNTNSGVALGLAFGKFVTENVSIDLEIDKTTLDFISGSELSQKSIGFIGRYHFSEKMGITPYLGAGFGVMASKGYAGVAQIHNGARNSNKEAMGSFVAGITKELTDRVKLRTELRYRIENSDDTVTGVDQFTDYLFNAGLSINFGDAPEQKTATTLVAQNPQLDGDNDGVSDANDRCPNTPSGTKVDTTGCAIVDGDDDNDGVPNSRDACPHSVAGAVVGNDGCEVKVVIELQGVHFDTDKATLKPVSISILNAAVRTLGEHGTIMVEVAGHTDSTASDAYNQDLSERRAKVVHAYLVAHGISANRMTWKGYGESQPIATNNTEEGRAKNRRTELNVK